MPTTTTPWLSSAAADCAPSALRGGGTLWGSIQFILFRKQHWVRACRFPKLPKNDLTPFVSVQ